MMIQTRRLRLQAMSERDADAAVALLTNDLVKQTYMLPDFSSPEQAYGLFSRICAMSHDESRFVRGIYLGEDWIGMINDVGIEGKTIELGYALLPEYHGQGYATEALTASIEAMFARGFDEVIAGAFPHNVASMRVMEKSGMHRIERTDRVEYRGQCYDCTMYSISKDK